MVVSPTGAFIDLLPKDLILITNPVWSALTSRLDGIWRLLRLGNPLLAIGHCIRLAVSTISKSKAGEMIAAMMPPIDEEFDTVVDFNGQHQLYFMVNKLKAKKKISFFHSDYEQWPYYYRADKEYYAKVDRIFTISPKCVDSLKKYFPNQSDKIGLMENISSLKLIDRLADYPVYDMVCSTNVLLTIGHVCENKGIFLAIDAASILKSKGVVFHWYFIGSIDKPEEYNSLIERKGLSSNITLMGIRSNPYPYIRRATVIVHPSKFEGRSIALDEAKLLCKSVVVTNFSTVTDQFTDRQNGSICQMTSESIADAVEELLSNEELRQQYIANLLAERHDNSSE
ncbi:MAG: glycosyltransferase, partial [Lactobacillus sp.]|nr:glycosyltransferase [Lactobacillus sp.]